MITSRINSVSCRCRHYYLRSSAEIDSLWLPTTLANLPHFLSTPSGLSAGKLHFLGLLSDTSTLAISSGALQSVQLGEIYARSLSRSSHHPQTFHCSIFWYILGLQDDHVSEVHDSEFRTHNYGIISALENSMALSESSDIEYRRSLRREAQRLRRTEVDSLDRDLARTQNTVSQIR
jgi:hypothetical protein